MIVLLAVPFSAIGAIWLLYAARLQHERSRVWVGLIALLGVDAETGVFMLLYLDLAYERGEERGADAKSSATCAKRSSKARSNGSARRS